MPKLIELLFEQGQIYLLLFIFFYSFICFDFLFKHSFRLMFFSISLFILSLISGLRFEVGTDWEPYKNLFNDLELDWSFLVNVFNFDFGYVLFNAFIRIFTDSYAVFLFLDSLIALGFIGWFIYKYSPLPNLSLFFFYNTYFISTYMGSNRRIIAIGLSLISLSALIETKRAKTYLYALIALLFHRTSFIVFFAKFLPTHVPKLKIVVLGLFISFIIGLFQLPFKLFGVISQAVSHLNNIPVFSKLIYYSDIDNNKAVVSENLNTAILFTFSSIKRLFLISIFYFFIVKNRLYDKFNIRLFVFYWFGFMGYLVFNGTPIFQIFFVYYSIVEITLIGRVIYSSGNRFKLVFYFISFIYGFLQLISALTAYPELYIPYKSYISF